MALGINLNEHFHTMDQIVGGICEVVSRSAARALLRLREGPGEVSLFMCDDAGIGLI